MNAIDPKASCIKSISSLIKSPEEDWQDRTNQERRYLDRKAYNNVVNRLRKPVFGKRNSGNQ